MAVEDLLGEGQTLLAEHATDLGVLGVELLVGGGKRLDRREVSPGVSRSGDGSSRSDGIGAGTSQELLL